MPRDRNIFLLLLLGASSTLAFPPTNIAVILFVSYSFLFYALFQADTLNKSFLYGFLFGFGHCLSGTFWLFSILGGYEGMEKLAFFFIIAGIILILSFEWSLFAAINYLSKKVVSNTFVQIVLIMPALATIVDWVKSWFATGFTWTSPADTLFDFGFGFLLPITGALGVNYIFYTLIGLVVYMIISKNYRLSLMILFVMISFIFLGKKINPKFTTPMKKSLYTQIIQTNKSKKDKQQRYKVIESIQSYQVLAQQRPFPELSVWPESTLSLSCQTVKRQIQNGFDAIRQNKTEVLYGSYEESDEKTYNAVISNSNNKMAYIKQHLIPFGEYTPQWMITFQEFIPSIFMNDISSDKVYTPIITNGIVLAPSICYEILFGDELRERNSEANILVHISDLGWFYNTIAKDYLLNVARVRAQEVQKPMIYVVNYGNSAFLSPYGEVEYISKQSTDTYAMYNNIIPYAGQTPYAKYGSTPLLGWLFGLIITSSVFSLILKRKKVV